MDVHSIIPEARGLASIGADGMIGHGRGNGSADGGSDVTFGEEVPITEEEGEVHVGADGLSYGAGSTSHLHKPPQIPSRKAIVMQRYKIRTGTCLVV